MTWTLDNVKHRHDGRSYRDRIGRPYYGSALRRVIEAEPPRSLSERNRMARALWIVGCGMVIGALVLGFLAAL